MKPFPIQLTATQRLSAAACSLVIGAVLLASFIYVPLCASLNRQRADLKALHVQVANARVMATQLAAEELALAETQQRRQTLQRRIGSGQSVARVLETLSQQAKMHRLELVATQPRADESKARNVSLGSGIVLTEIPLTIQLTGRYRNLGEFLAEVPQAPYAASIKSLTLVRPAIESPKVQADLILAIYLTPEAF